MAPGEEVDAELARGVQCRLLRFAGDERVIAFVRGLDQTCAAAPRDHGDALDLLRPFSEDEGLALG